MSGPSSSDRQHLLCNKLFIGRGFAIGQSQFSQLWQLKWATFLQINYQTTPSTGKLLKRDNSSEKKGTCRWRQINLLCNSTHTYNLQADDVTQQVPTLEGMQNKAMIKDNVNSPRNESASRGTWVRGYENGSKKTFFSHSLKTKNRVCKTCLLNVVKHLATRINQSFKGFQLFCFASLYFSRCRQV